MRVFEARALSRRVADDMDAAHTAVRDALNVIRHGLIVPHAQSEKNEIYAGEGAGDVARIAQERLEEVAGKLLALSRSVEVTHQAVRQARKEASEQ